METYFDLIPEELIRLILIKTLNEESPWTPRNCGIPIFSKVIDSVIFWKEAFEYKGFMEYIKRGLFNKDLMYLLEGVPVVIKKYSKYKPDEMFNIWDFEYSNIETSYHLLQEYMNDKRLEISELDVSVFSDLDILTDNLHLPESSESNDFQDSRFFVSYVKNPDRSIRKFDHTEMIMKILKGSYTVELRYSDIYPNTPLKLKDDKKSFENLFIYILYHRFNFTIKK